MYLFFSLMILALACSACHAAIGHDFKVPDNYIIQNESDNYTLLQSDPHHTISISRLDNDTDEDLMKYLLEESYYDFIYSDNYTKGSYEVEENYYNQEYQRGIMYFCKNEKELLVIDYKIPISEDVRDSPVEVILESLGS